MTMNLESVRTTRATSRGFATIHLAVTLTGMLLFTGLAVDAGRGYVVKAQLTKAVDGAALAAARSLNSGSPGADAARVFKANFPPGHLGTPPGVDPTTAADFFTSRVDANGVNIVTVQATVQVPTTFMRLGNYQQMQVSSLGEARRRMVDLSLVLDVSSSIGWRWPYVRDAARGFVQSFDATHDRLCLVTYGNGARVVYQMPSSRGFNKTTVVNAIPTNLPGGSTNMVEGLYRGWDELRSVPSGQQSGLRVIVLFTDGATNSVPARWTENGNPSAISRALRTWDFPDNGADPDNQTHLNPRIDGLYHPESGSAIPAYTLTTHWNSTQTIPQVPWMPPTSYHQFHRSAGIPDTFPLVSNTLTVNGQLQSAWRPMRDFNAGQNAYPAQVFNINNAARNLVEIIADAARNDDDGDYPIRIYTIGMGELVTYNLGTRQEPSSSILQRVANDPVSQDFNEDQLEGRYYFAQTANDMSAAFAALQNQIIRLSK
jgi:Flp pilus assembly protein TadG